MSEKCFIENTLHGLEDHLTIECVLSVCNALGLVSSKKISKNKTIRQNKKNAL